jgi:hypothetical protein
LKKLQINWKYKKTMRPYENNKLLIGMFFYSLFKTGKGRLTITLVEELGLNQSELEELTKTGCFAFISYSQKTHDFNDCMMTQQSFQSLRVSSPELHTALRDFRKKAQSRWSTEHKRLFAPQIDPKNISSTPDKWELYLAKAEATANCARLLKQAGQTDKLNNLLTIFAPEHKHD